MEADYIKYGNQAEMTVMLEQAISDFIASLLKIASYGAVGYFLAQGVLDPAVAVASLVLAGAYFNAFKDVFSLINVRAKGEAAAKRLQRLLSNDEQGLCRCLPEGEEEGLLEIRELCYSYPEEESRLARLDVPLFRLEPGEKVLLRGANGSGKTTLMRLITGILHPDAGTVRFRGLETEKMSDSLRAEAFAYLMQIDERGEESVSQLISQIAAEKEDEVWELLRRLAFKEENREKEVKWLSGGELKKVYIALTFVQDAALLILDEPSLHLDQEALEVLIDLLERDPRAEILITHDPALQSVCQRHYQIKMGAVNVLEEVFHGSD